MRQRHLLIGGLVLGAGAVALWVWCRHTARSSRGLVDTELYYANESDHVFHMEGCPLLDMNDTIRVFASVSDALYSGFRPCHSCYPLL